MLYAEKADELALRLRLLKTIVGDETLCNFHGEHEIMNIMYEVNAVDTLTLVYTGLDTYIYKATGRYCSGVNDFKNDELMAQSAALYRSYIICARWISYPVSRLVPFKATLFSCVLLSFGWLSFSYK